MPVKSSSMPENITPVLGILLHACAPLLLTWAPKLQKEIRATCMAGLRQAQKLAAEGHCMEERNEN